jgi:hypothetical protein
VFGNGPGEQSGEVLTLAASSFQTECGTVAIQTLKRRKHSMREVPLPPELITTSSNAPSNLGKLYHAATWRHQYPPAAR